MNTTANTGGQLTSVRWSLFAIFAVSGFAGLIYEAIWGRYLKLFLGHSAYAQTFVIAIFMGGMALGSWIAARYSNRLRSLLAGYAYTEIAIGLFALIFQPLFDTLTTWAYDSAIPGLGDPTIVQLFKQGLCIAVILPPSVLLGMTFPFMSGGIIRLFPNMSGSSLAMLYFTNSIGAALGVFATGLFLVQSLGLPGTTLLAGIINLLVGLVVWLIAKRVPEPKTPATETHHAAHATSPKLLFLVAGFTGFASFLYEIGWLRMLSMVLGSSSHAFEIMLGTFIAGLALGGYWIKGRIDQLASPAAFLARVQLVMGALAIATLALYNTSFDMMAWLMSGLTRTDAGYGLFNFASHFFAILIMLPAAFCAGMTLPLITLTLLKSGYGERSIGQVYASNTVGAILGVLVATHVAMPALGLKGLIIFGAIVDIALAVFIYRHLKRHRAWKAAIVFGLALCLFTGLFVQFDPLRMASGVYRVARIMSDDNYASLYHADGKTSTVDVVRGTDGRLILITNGKPDASINPKTDGPPTSDEGTQAFLASIPLALSANPADVAVIGIGCGMTSSVVLASPTPQTVKTIEIEPKMVDGAQFFKPVSTPLFDDSRSEIIIDDARTYLSSTNGAYDIIISEPSNPWVSGVASLFSEQFYKRISRHLKPQGIFAQWVQLYELTPDLISSIVKAMRVTFPHITFFATDDSNIAIICTLDRPTGPLLNHIFEAPKLARRMSRHAIDSTNAFEVYRIASLSTLNPLFDSYQAPPNSDYFPYLDNHAAKQRFLRASAQDLLKLRTTVVPIVDMLQGNQRYDVDWDKRTLPPYTTASKALFPPLSNTFGAAAIARVVAGETGPHQAWIRRTDMDALQHLSNRLFKCGDQIGDPLSLRRAIMDVGKATNTYLDKAAAGRLWSRVLTGRCVPKLDSVTREWLLSMAAIGRRDVQGILKHAGTLLKSGEPKAGINEMVLLEATMLSHILKADKNAALALWREHASRLKVKEPLLLHHRLLLAHSGELREPAVPQRPQPQD